MRCHDKHTKTTFDDGCRSVDYVLVYNSCSKDNGSDGWNYKLKARDTFLKNLQSEGIEFEVDEDHRSETHFIKLHATRVFLVKYCELLKWQMPVKLSELYNDDQPRRKFASNRGAEYFDLANREPTMSFGPTSKYKVFYEFSRVKGYLFDQANPNFFCSAIRIVTIWYTLQRTSYGTEDSNEVGIQKLIHDRVFVDAYPIHDGPAGDRRSKRGVLLKKWASLRVSFTNQPIDEIKNYFGPQIALYFAWLGLYTCMLAPAAVAGLVCFVYGWSQMHTSEYVRDVCSSDRQYIMTPLCDRCDFWVLEETCFLAKFRALFDNNFTVIFAVFMSLWTTLLLEIWKRYSSHLVHNWGLTNFTRRLEPKRPQYLSQTDSSNDCLLPDEEHRSWRPLRYVLSYSISVLGISLVLATSFTLIIYRMSLNAADNFYGSWDSVTYRTFVMPTTGAAINLVVVFFLNYGYYYVAVFLTEKELHRTQSEFDENLSLKIYLFQFVNYYSSIFYIAFVKGKFVGSPAKYHRVFGFRQEECSPAGCMVDLTLQIAIIMVGKQVLQTINEMVYAQCRVLLSKFREIPKARRAVRETRQWRLDFNLLPLDFFPMFNEYLEMMIQFGFITIFVVAFPIAPVFALLNNIFEIRLDAKKFLLYHRRPIPRRVRNIGSWYSIMQVICRLSVLSNACIIAFSSNFIPNVVHSLYKAHNLTNSSFLDFTLSEFATTDFEPRVRLKDSMYVNVTTSFYEAFRHPPSHEKKYELTLVYWHILAAQLAFIVAFQNFVGFFQIFADWAISDVPRIIKMRMRKEEQLISDIIVKRERAKARAQKKKRRKKEWPEINEVFLIVDEETSIS